MTVYHSSRTLHLLLDHTRAARAHNYRRDATVNYSCNGCKEVVIY